MRNFREYDVWKDSLILSKEIFSCTKNFPKQDPIINQMQRAVISIPSNIAEGASRASSVEFARYLEIALGSTYELETQIELSYVFQYINIDVYNRIVNDIHSIEKRLTTFINTLRTK